VALFVALVVIASAGSSAAACGSIAGPRGWAPAQPVESGKLTLVPYRKKVFALREGSADVVWQFPPRDKSTYRVSEVDRQELAALAQDLGLSAGDPLIELIGDLNVQGSTVETLESAIDASSLASDARSSFKSRIEDITSRHKRALDGVRALYGDLALPADGTEVYVPTYGGWLFALDAETGALRWLADLDPMVGGVAVTESVLYVGSKSGRFYAIDPGSGAVGDSVKLDGEIWATPTLAEDGDDILVPTLGGSLYRLDDELQVRWRFDDAEGALAGTVTAGGGFVFAGAFDNKLYALDEATGEARWSIESDNWFWSQPVVNEGTVFAASLDGKVYAVDVGTGESRWSRPFDTGSQVRSGLAVSGDALIVGARDGRVHRLALDDGTPTGQPLQIGTRLESDLVAGADDTVYVVPRQSRLYVIDASLDSLAADFYELPN
jgi:outer membrane protein assembly factor BamB